MSDAGSARKVAVIGMGRMGAAMARRLADRGFRVAVYNRTAARAAEVAAEIGAAVVESPAAAARWVAGEQADGPADGSAAGAAGGVIILSLADDNACRAVYLGDDGLLSALVPGTVIADTSTIDPATARELAAAVSAAGGSMLDSPVSGSVPAALSGGLTVMVGGDEAALRVAGPVLRAIGKRVVPVGPSGSGAVVKLAVNAVVHLLNQALSEAIVLAEKAGVDRRVFYSVIADSAAAAPFVGYKQAAFEDPGQVPVAFALGLMGKDLRLITDLAERVGAEVTAIRAVKAVTEQAMAQGYGDADMSAMAQYLRRS